MKTIHYFNHEAELNVPYDSELKEKGLKQTMCGYARESTTSIVERVNCKSCRIAMVNKGYELGRDLSIKEKLMKIYFNCSTRKFGKVFSEYAKERGFSKWDSRRKDIFNAYYAEGKDEGWDRIDCNIYNPKDKGLQIHIVLRKNSYLIIRVNGKEIYEFDRRQGFITYQEEDLKKVLDVHSKLFNMLLAIA